MSTIVCQNFSFIAVQGISKIHIRYRVFKLPVYSDDPCKCNVQCFMEPLKKVQVEGHLMFAEPHELFGNLDELCYVRITFSSLSHRHCVKKNFREVHYGRDRR